MTTLTVLAYERHIRLVQARAIDFSWAWRAITYIWLYSLAWSGAPLLGWNRYIPDVHGLGCAVAWRSEDAKDSSFALFLFLGCLVAPVGVIAHCYGHILYSVHRVSRKTTNAPPPDYFQGRKFCITKRSNFLPT